MRTTLETLWSDRRISLTLCVGLVAVAALISAWLAPRGPLSTSQAYWSMAFSIVLGLLVGLVSRSGWSVLGAPLVYALVFEVARQGLSGATVDGIQLGSVYGVIALVVGRLVHEALSLAPLMFGSLGGVLISRAAAGERVGFAVWGGMAAMLLIGIAVIVLLARPASTHPILGSDGQPLAGSIAELVTVEIGGAPQALMIRGRDMENPLLLHLAGGPGGTDLGAMRSDVSLEQDFVVVVWDQRGTGKSYAAIDPLDKMTLAQMVSDTLEVTDYLRQRFNHEQIFLMGNSWGSLLGVLAVQQRPDWFHAYIGTGQMVDVKETDVLFYHATLDWARRQGQSELEVDLLALGQPPYQNLLDYERIVSHEGDWNPNPGRLPKLEMPFNTFVPENSLMDRINAMRGLLDTYVALYPQIQELDLRQSAQSLEVPVTIIAGKYEAPGRALPLAQWYADLRAPSKRWIDFENSGHRAMFEEPGRFADVMAEILEEINPLGR